MKIKVSNARDSQLLIIIHIALTTLILFIISWGSGCEKKDDLASVDPGPEINIEDLAEAYFLATDNPDQSKIRAGNMTLYEINQRVELGPTLKFVDIVRTIKCILRDKKNTQIALSIETYLYNPYGEIIEKKPTIDYVLNTQYLETSGLPTQEGDHCPDLIENSNDKKSDFYLEPYQDLTDYKENLIERLLSDLTVPPESREYLRLTSLARHVAQGLEEFHKKSQQELSTLTKKVVKVSLHNLVVESLKLEPPKKVRGKPGCSGIAECVFNAKQIQFDIVEWFNASDFRKTRSRWVVTNQLPSFPEGMNEGFGGFISKCESGFQTVTSKDKKGNPIEQDYLITTCPEVLRNF